MTFHKQLEELSDLLHSGVSDKKERHVMTTEDCNGKHSQIINREAFLEFIIECAINEIPNIQDELEERGIS
jgi:hypothetical protein